MCCSICAQVSQTFVRRSRPNLRRAAGPLRVRAGWGQGGTQRRALES